ncbi:MAG: hypothetical protein ACP5M9_03670 [Candidatus Micrarchaeia archaeon]
MRGQFWSFDAVFGILLFILGIIILTYSWITISGNYSSISSDNTAVMQAELNQLSSALFLRGNPTNWNSVVNVSNPSTWSGVSVGLGSNYGSSDISENKLLALLAMSTYNYSLTKETLGVTFDYYINITTNIPSFSIQIGKNPNNFNPTSVNKLSEPVLINGQPGKATITIWTNTTFGVS